MVSQAVALYLHPMHVILTPVDLPNLEVVEQRLVMQHMTLQK